MNSEDTTDELVTLFKALADSNRLKIIGLLAQKAYSVEELAALLELKAPTVSHHLGKLVKTGLISARAEGYYSVYHLDQQALEALSRRILSPAQMSAAADGVDVNAYDHKVVRVFSLPDGRLKTIPAQRKKLEAILGMLYRPSMRGRVTARNKSTKYWRVFTKIPPPCAANWLAVA